ncbi:hypothetical protein [Nonomuraea turcica]|uniref:hypothetical protein n=1 Tax=Nonomuraea sp. G32 TaxID=3067274 RepID=UPI00273AA56B|nr:hypothetical protein [Nonomuraea sp. G32]MDP4511820.1 hypothetical protein [Nonomuraea sp. G32]
MTNTVRQSADGPRNDDYTCQVATAPTAAVRALNHETLSNAGVTYPSTINAVLGAIGHDTARLDLLLQQLSEALLRMLTSTQLGDDHGDRFERVDNAQSELTAARAAARTLIARLEHSFNATADLHVTDGRED